MVRGLGSVALALGLGGVGIATAEKSADNRWAVIAAGSSGFWNYRHQADACHAYQLMVKSGIPASQIILMMQDDVAGASENPFPGKLYNKPATGAPVDVYDGCKVDYRGSIVTADLFLKVITGDDTNLPTGGSGKVLKSTSADRVFLNFVDHGGVGIIAFPNGPYLHAEQLSKGLQTMQSKKMFKELTFYMEACESGSMFPDLTKDGKIFAVTAANADESSYGFYCAPDDVVDGKHVGSCLGDLFSISWMEDSDTGKWSSETVKQQVTKVTARTNKSHVTTFGDLSLESETIGNFEMLGDEVVAEALKSSQEGAWDVRDIPLHTSYWRWVRAEAQDKDREWEALQRVVANRKADEELFSTITRKACGSTRGCTEQMASERQRIKDNACHQTLAMAVHEICPRRQEHDAGGWNGFSMKYSQVLVNLCESKSSLQKETAELEQLVRAECAAASAKASGVVASGEVEVAASAEGSRWAVIAAGSSGFFNYRHQADACHAYQLMVKSGIPASQIILMMQDDVAGASENPFPGKLYNKPADSDPVDVYDGCKVDYRGSIVTADLFLKVITGDDSNLPSGGSGKVLKSTAADRVFLNFVDHGGVGIIAFPNGPFMHAEELSKGLKTMQSKKMFKELTFYMEACESGSMFPDLTKDGKIFAVTAANADESSWGFYCSPNDVVEGKHMGSCLGDLFSIAWMEDSDAGKWSSETVKQQVTKVTARTNKSHVTTFGDLSLESETIGNFEMLGDEVVAEALKTSISQEGAYDVRDIPLHTAYWRWEHASADSKAKEWDTLQRIVANRKADEELFATITRKACGSSRHGCTEQMALEKKALKDNSCHIALATAVHEACPRREEHNSGGWNGFSMKFSQVLVNICESRASLQKETAELEQLVRAECAAASRPQVESLTQLVV